MSNEFTQQVLIRDDLFSFERGAAKVGVVLSVKLMLLMIVVFYYKIVIWNECNISLARQRLLARAERLDQELLVLLQGRHRCDG